MSIIREGKTTRYNARSQARQDICAIRCARDQTIKDSLDFEGNAFSDLLEYAADEHPGKGLTAAELAQMSGGDFSVQEIAGNIRFANKGNYWAEPKSRYHQIRAKECKVEVEKHCDYVERRYVEVDQNGQIIPGSSMVLHSRKNRYYIRNK